MLFSPSGPQSPRRRSRLNSIFLTIGIVLAIYFLFFAGDEHTKSRAYQDKAEKYAHKTESLVADSDAGDHLARPAVRRHKEMIVASMKGDDTSWLAEYFQDWSRKIYVVNDKNAPLTVALNKGRESMVYLTYVVNSQAGLIRVFYGDGPLI